MSIKASQAVWDHSASKGNDRLLLLAIADASDHEGHGCFKGKETLARMANCDRATVTRSVADLEASGELEVQRRPGRSSLYRVVLPGLDDGAQVAPTSRAQSAPRGAQSAPTPGAPMRRDPFSTRSSSVASVIEKDMDNRRRAEARIMDDNMAKLDALDEVPRSRELPEHLRRGNRHIGSPLLPDREATG